MKKVLKMPFRKKKELKKQVSMNTIEDHREEVLAKGRKFRYPFQYAKHRLVINTLVIGVAAVVLLAVFGWLQLYKFQSTDDILYRFTKIIPLSVASVDGENVRFSDYLMIFKSSVAAIESQEGALLGADDEMIRAQYKRQALNSAIEFAYALRLQRELGVEISREEILEAEKEHRTVDGVERNEDSFADIIRINFGLTVSEYERLLLLSLTRRAIAAEVDEVAANLSLEVERILGENGGDFAAAAEALSGEVFYEETGESVSTLNLDGGRAAAASGLEVSEWSERFLSRNGDGYYFVKLLGRDGEQVRYASLRVPFSEFERRVRTMREEGRIVEFIDIDRVADEGEEKE